MTVKDRAHNTATTIAGYGISRSCDLETITGLIERAITAAVAEEREACAEIARKVRANTVREWVRQTSIDIEALILARSTASAPSTEPAEK